VSTYAQDLLDKRARAWEAAKEILDRCAIDKRERTAEEDEMFQRANADIAKYGAMVDEWTLSERQKREGDIAREAYESIVRPEVKEVHQRQVSQLETFLRGGGSGSFDINLGPTAQMFHMIRGGMDAKEARAIYTDGGGRFDCCAGGVLQHLVPVPRSELDDSADFPRVQHGKRRADDVPDRFGSRCRYACHRARYCHWWDRPGVRHDASRRLQVRPARQGIERSGC
jgi:hypothetical protein